MAFDTPVYANTTQIENVESYVYLEAGTEIQHQRQKLR